MDLLSVFKRQSTPLAAADGAEPLDAVAVARKRARQRLIGATILVIIAVIGFPILFDTAPRPVPVDVPIEIPRKEGASPLVLPAARLPASGGAVSGSAVSGGLTPSAAASAPTTAAGSTMGAVAAATSVGKAASGSGTITETQAEQGREVKPPVPDAAAAIGAPGPARTARVAPPPATTAAAKGAATEHAATRPADKPVAKSTTANGDASRARALLEDKPVAKADSTAAATAASPKPSGESRYAIQVAAFSADAGAAEMRGKLEKAGVKSYTQVVETPAGKRIRVRVGPFNSRDDAEKAAGKIKAAGLPSSIVPL